ncbi:MAG: hypothetical protein J0H99_15645, partial [Rhodospirillales bacterium]|nr:hypothetical protein [Rhodospirillales bacterium]
LLDEGVSALASHEVCHGPERMPQNTQGTSAGDSPVSAAVITHPAGAADNVSGGSGMIRELRQ